MSLDDHFDSYYEYLPTEPRPRRRVIPRTLVLAVYRAALRRYNRLHIANARKRAHNQGNLTKQDH